MRHHVECEDPQADAEAGGDDPPGEARHDRLRDRAGDEEVAERIEEEADDEMDDFAEEPALEAEHGLHERRRLERPADAGEERRHHAGPKFPGDIRGDAGNEGADQQLAGELGESGFPIGIAGEKAVVISGLLARGGAGFARLAPNLGKNGGLEVSGEIFLASHIDARRLWPARQAGR
jgi:hypothetical protein